MSQQLYFEQYQEIIGDSLKKIRKTSFKKIAIMNDYITKLTGFLDKQIYGRIQPTNFLFLYILMFGCHNPKMHPIILQTFQRLFSHNYILPSDNLSNSQQFMRNQYKQFIIMPLKQYKQFFHKSIVQVYLQTIINIPYSERTQQINVIIAKNISLIFRLAQDSVPVYCIKNICQFIVDAVLGNRNQEYEKILKSVFLEVVRHAIQALREYSERRVGVQVEGEMSVKGMCERYGRYIADEASIKVEIGDQSQGCVLVPVEINRDIAHPVVQTVNQINEKNGKFGWCIVCRKSANYYCKQLRVPVCSFTCKQTNLNQTQQFDKLHTQQQKCQSTFSNHLQTLCQIFSKYLSHTDIRRRTIFSQIFIHLSSQLRKISLKSISPGIKTSLKNIFKECCGNVIAESEAFTGCMISIKKMIPLKIFNAEVEVLLCQLAKKLGHFITPVHIKEEILRFCRDFIRNQGIFQVFMDIDCHMLRRDVAKQLVSAIADVYKGVKPPQGLTMVPAQDPNVRKFCLQVLYQLQKAIRSSQRQLPPNQCKQVQHIKSNKNQLKQAIKKFNQCQKPIKIIKKLIKQKFFKSPTAQQSLQIANFLMKYNKRLNHVNVGILIGDYDPLAIEIRDNFMELMDFHDFYVDEGLRILLGYFTIPGQSQVVERIIDCFSKVYRQQNIEKTVFKHSDAVYSFSYLLMMLQTNLHNPQVIQKMSLQAFSGLSKNMNGQGQQFPAQFLQTIYNSISNKQLGFHTKHKQIQMINAYQQGQVKKAQQIHNKQLQQTAQQQFNNLVPWSSCYNIDIDNNNKDINKDNNENNCKNFQKFDMKLLCEQLYPEILSAFAWRVHESQEKEEIIKNVDVIQNMVKYSLEKKIQQIVGIAVKNVWEEMMKTNTMKKYILMEKLLIWVREYNMYLYGQWASVIYLFSMFYRNKLIKKDHSNKNHIIVISQQKCYLYDSFIDSILSKTSKFNHNNLLCIIDALIDTSKQQISQNQHPFCLQKIGEILQHNNSRLADILPLCWVSLRQHYVQLGKNKVQKVALFGYDFLKQLVTKFLKRKDLQFYQKQYMKPFQQIFNTTITFGVKEYVVGGLSYFANNYHHNITKDGWRIIFNIICSAFDEDQDPNVKQKAHTVIKKLYETKFTMLDLDQNYADFVQILGRMARDKEEQYPKSCLDAIRIIIQYFHVVHDIDLDDLQIENSEKFDLIYWQTLWLPLLNTIYGICGDFRIQVQNQAIQLLFYILMNYGKLFKYQFWKMIMQGILRPAFQQITYTSQSRPIHKKALQQWLRNSFSQLFLSINKLIQLYFKSFKLFLPDILKIYESCILNNPNRILIQISIQALNDLINSVANQFDQLNWNDFIELLENIARKSYPKQLESLDNWKNNQGNDSQSYQNKCQTMNLLLITSQNVLEKFHAQLKDQLIVNIGKFCDKIYEFCRKINRDIMLREALWKNGFFSDLKSLPGMIKQQHQALKSITIGKYYLSTRSDVLLDSYITHILLIFKQYRYSLILQPIRQAQIQSEQKQRQNTMLQIIILETVVPQIRKIGFNKLVELGYKKLLFNHILDVCTQKTFCSKCKFCEFCENSVEREKKFTAEMKAMIRQIFQIDGV